MLPELDFDFLNLLSEIINFLIVSLNDSIQNYGISIMVLAVVIKLLFLPLQRAAATHTKKLQKLRPQLERLKKTYKDDLPRQRREIGALFKRHGLRPWSGLLPTLIQIPVFFAVVKVFDSMLELGGEAFAWIDDLALPDPQFVLPVVGGILMFIQLRYVPTADNTLPEVLTFIFPIIFVISLATFSSALNLYYATGFLLQIGVDSFSRGPAIRLR